MNKCPLCRKNIKTQVFYEDDKIIIIKDLKRPGKLIVSKEHLPMIKEGLESLFAIHVGGTNLKDSGHVSIDHLHVYYE